MNNGKTRASLLGLVAAYLLYLSYELFAARADTNTTMTPAARTLFIILFVLAAVALAVYAVHVWRHSDEEERQERRRDDENTLK